MSGAHGKELTLRRPVKAHHALQLKTNTSGAYRRGYADTPLADENAETSPPVKRILPYSARAPRPKECAWRRFSISSLSLTLSHMQL